MKIKWIEDRTLVDHCQVKAGDVADLPAAEAAAYIANGVAVAVEETKKATKEVTVNE